MVVNPVKIDYFQYQLMYSDARFDGESDFAIKCYLDPWSDCVIDGQSEKADTKLAG